MAIDIVLVNPEIPQNTGNVARTCVAVGAGLHLVEPLGFAIDDRRLKRAGLDYWFDIDPSLWANLDDLLRHTDSSKSIYYVTTKGGRVYSDIEYGSDVMLVFGSETRGLPEELLLTRPERCLRIPMLGGRRSLNLANAVAVMTYEVLRQQGFPSLVRTGSLMSKGDEDRLRTI